MRKSSIPLNPNARALSIENAMVYASCSKSKLWELRKEHPSLDIRIGSGVRIDRIELDKVLDSMKSSEN